MSADQRYDPTLGGEIRSLEQRLERLERGTVSDVGPKPAGLLAISPKPTGGSPGWAMVTWIEQMRTSTFTVYPHRLLKVGMLATSIQAGQGSYSFHAGALNVYSSGGAHVFYEQRYLEADNFVIGGTNYVLAGWDATGIYETGTEYYPGAYATFSVFCPWASTPTNWVMGYNPGGITYRLWVEDIGPA